MFWLGDWQWGPHTAMLAKDDPNSPMMTGNCVVTFCLLV